MTRRILAGITGDQTVPQGRGGGAYDSRRSCSRCGERVSGLDVHDGVFCMAFPSSDFRNLNAFFSRPSAKSLRYDMFSRGRTACPFMPKRAPLPVAPSSPRPTCQCPVSGDKQCRVVRPCKPGTSGARQLVVTGGTFQLGKWMEIIDFIRVFVRYKKWEAEIRKTCVPIRPL